MKSQKPKDTTPKGIIKDAQKAATDGDTEHALLLFKSCINEYLSKNMSVRALATAKYAKTLLGPNPKVQALLYRLYTSMGLHGDAKLEYDSCAEMLKKDELPVLQNLTEEEFIDILDIMQIIHIAPYINIIEQHHAGDDVYIVISGTLEVFRDSLKISTMSSGDIFGELGFFNHKRRSATVRTAEECTLIKIPADKLRDLCVRHPSIKFALDLVYTQRALKKAVEDLGSYSFIDLNKDDILYEYFIKGEKISFDDAPDVTIVKHGVVEINYDEKGFPKKEFLKPGSVLKKYTGKAMARSNCEIIKVHINLIGNPRKRT